MGATVLKNGLVFADGESFRRLDVKYENGVIIALGEDITDGESTVECRDCLVLPGLVDVHMHGACGKDVCSTDESSLDRIAQYEFSRGVTLFCPAVMTFPPEKISSIVGCISRYASERRERGRAQIPGIHLEGPFLNGKKCGAQKKEYIQLPDTDKIKKWQQEARGMIKLITIAPELPGALDCIRTLGDSIHFSLGHTCADHTEAKAALDAGADHITHLFNAMTPFHHRDTGVVGAAADNEDCFVELICDGVHLSPTAVRTAFKIFGEDRIVLVSDSMEAAGMPDGEYFLGGQKVFKKGSSARLEDGTLAGSVTDLYECMINAVKMGIPLESAVRCATLNPCRSIGISESFGSISPGKGAHFLILGKNDLSVKKVI